MSAHVSLRHQPVSFFWLIQQCTASLVCSSPASSAKRPKTLSPGCANLRRGPSGDRRSASDLRSPGGSGIEPPPEFFSLCRFGLVSGDAALPDRCRAGRSLAAFRRCYGFCFLSLLLVTDVCMN
ncbi:hypothetical protein ACJRO7_009718 [Eucalyptus globulus]|uniref:Secreted protein n=1 Tax=Eucalyptus globulus TaxID=34317 RepID=A0ABD3LD71_EUCGL